MNRGLTQKTHVIGTLLLLALNFELSPSSPKRLPASRFGEIDNQSSYIVLGKVISVEKGKGAGPESHLLSVEVISFLRGLPSTDRVWVSLGSDGPRFTDYLPETGDLVVVYLGALKRSQGVWPVPIPCSLQRRAQR